MDPVPVEDQTWSMWTWMAYWATDTINLGTWQTASSIIAVGLTWRDAIPIMIVGTGCVAVPMVLNGRFAKLYSVSIKQALIQSYSIGAKLHVPFSVIIRSSFGYYLGYFCIVSRCILAMFWLGIQGANGAYAVKIMVSHTKLDILFTRLTIHRYQPSGQASRATIQADPTTHCPPAQTSAAEA